MYNKLTSCIPLLHFNTLKGRKEVVYLNNELSAFVQETLRQIEAATSEHNNVGEVEFEIAIVKTTTANGKIGVSVLGAGGEFKTHNVSKVKFRTRLKGAIAPMASIVQWPSP